LAQVVREGRAGETYDATALVHEAYLKLIRSEQLNFSGRAHFMAVAARAMRQVLVDKAEARSAMKRGGEGLDITLSDTISAEKSVSAEELLDLDKALAELAKENERAARVVEFRFFGGMSAEETAEVLGVALPTITRDWRFARAWLS